MATLETNSPPIFHRILEFLRYEPTNLKCKTSTQRDLHSPLPALLTYPGQQLQMKATKQYTLADFRDRKKYCKSLLMIVNFGEHNLWFP